MLSLFKIIIFIFSSVILFNEGNSATRLDFAALIENIVPGTKVTVDGAGEICVTGNTQKFTKIMDNEDGAFQDIFPCASSVNLTSLGKATESWQNFMSFF